MNWRNRLFTAAVTRLRTSYDWQVTLDRFEPAAVAGELDVVVATVTGAGDFPAIVPMLTGLLRHVGRPRAILVVDDGTLDAEQRRVIESIDPGVRFHLPTIDPALPGADVLARYAAADPMGKKLAMLIELTTIGDAPVLYTDTDIRYLGGSDSLRELLRRPIDVPRYMQDHSTTSLDSRVLPVPDPRVNSGFLLLPSRLEWGPTMARCADLLDEPEWFTEQTVAHFAVIDAAGEPLPPEEFVLRWDDRHVLWSDDLEGAVLRHYVTPVRHKFWLGEHGGVARALRASVGR